MLINAFREKQFKKVEEVSMLIIGTGKRVGYLDVDVVVILMNIIREEMAGGVQSVTPTVTAAAHVCVVFPTPLICFAFCLKYNTFSEVSIVDIG